MAMQSNYREESGLRFLMVLVGGIVIVSILLAIVVAIFGHFAYPDPGLI